MTGCLVAISIYRYVASRRLISHPLLIYKLYSDTIVEKFEPHKDTITSYKWSWAVPVVVLIILSFPPLVKPFACF